MAANEINSRMATVKLEHPKTTSLGKTLMMHDTQNEQQQNKILNVNIEISKFKSSLISQFCIILLPDSNIAVHLKARPSAHSMRNSA